MRFGNLGAAPGAKPQRPMVRMNPDQQQAQALQQQALQTEFRARLAAIAAGAGVQPAGDNVPPGSLIQYYSDLSSGVIAPEDMRIETMQYRVQIAPDGSVNSESQSIQIISRYNFVIRRVIGFMMNPDFAGAAPSLVDFNIQEDGRNFTLFKTDMSMGALVNCGGSGNVAEWDGVYITVPGTQLSVLWSIDTARWAALVGATKEFGVQIIGDLVVCRGDGDNY